MARLVVTNFKLVGHTGRFSLTTVDDRITEIYPLPAAHDEAIHSLAESSARAQQADRVIDAQGAYLLPGLWDEHVHVDLCAQQLTRLDVSDARDPHDLIDKIAHYIEQIESGKAEPQLVEYPRLIQASGFRPSQWSYEPSVAELDEKTKGYQVIAISGDVHCGLLNSVAQEAYGLEHHEGLMREQEWFDLLNVFAHTHDHELRLKMGVEHFIEQCAAKGLVGVRDMSFTDLPWTTWDRSIVKSMAVEVSIYPEKFQLRLDEGVTSGQKLVDDDDADIAYTQFKIIVDGSLGTCTAYCKTPYPDGGYGIESYSQKELYDYVLKATQEGFSVAIHGIGDAAIEDILLACEQVVAQGLNLKGSIEHAQLIDEGQAERIAKLGLIASVQPAHLLDDYPLAQKNWPTQMDRCYCFKDLLDAGVTLALGSDGPVACVDPWLAMAAAVYRGPVDRDDQASGESTTAHIFESTSSYGQADLLPTSESWEWGKDQRLTVKEALLASTRHQEFVPGVFNCIDKAPKADFILVDRDPYLGTNGKVSGKEFAQNLLETAVLLTVRHSRVTYEKSLCNQSKE